MDLTGLFFCTTEDKTLHQKGQECSDGKKAMMNTSLCTNMVGDIKETPLVIWKSLKLLLLQVCEQENIAC